MDLRSGVYSGDGDFVKSPLFELIVLNAPVCIALLRGPSFLFEVVNPVYAAIAPGISMPGKTVAEVFPEIENFIVPLLQRVLETGEPYRIDDQPLSISRDLKSASELRYFSFSYTRITDGPTPDSHSILVLAIETTDRRNEENVRAKTEAELKRQWRTFDTALSNNADFIYTFDLEGRLTYVNRALLSLWNLSLDDALGKNFFDLNYPDPLAKRLHSQIQAVIDTGERVKDETPFTGPTGETREYEYIFVPVFTATGSLEAVTGSTRDITDRKHAAEQELARREILRESAKLESLGIMAGGVAHDFNNLLTGIMGHASLLEAMSGSPEQQDSAAQIVIASERAAELTRQMLAFSGRGQFVIDEFDLNSLIKDNIALFRASLLASSTLDLQLETADCAIQADRAQIQQVVMNLLINASEAARTPAAIITVRTAILDCNQPRFSNRLHSVVAAGRYVVLEVTDSGIGMDDQTLKRLFDPFFTTKFTGRGLGLAAVLGIVKGHRGDIVVDSQLGVGSTFKVFLPAALGKPSETPVSVQTPIERQSARLAVLVVDDEDVVRKIATRALSAAGFQTEVARNGREALEILNAKPGFSLVLLDLTMPVMTGEQALPVIGNRYPDLPVLLSSGYNTTEVIQRLSSHHIAGVLQKPYTASTLLAAVSKTLQLPKAPSSGSLPN